MRVLGLTSEHDGLNYDGALVRLSRIYLVCEGCYVLNNYLTGTITLKHVLVKKNGR